ncbi:hypothetical protein [Teredinibacter sp. KSP-S5-2]|uniref:hypothetical protein n=1 Tax=Teredinibacter sp. KSP-S5-2 TaxID=3034506 RepID=UPI002934764F|nr:hypothetical protein [Teredinibacter sp. KSP-S5-2]WNO10506.1 hypothetical protein P5V12_04905 [Teredinibacter sp. KSP-S5-2]
MRKSDSVTVYQVNDRIEIFIPISLKRYGGKKMMVSPEKKVVNPDRFSPNDFVLFQALLKAHMWNDMLLEGAYASIAELSEGEGLAEGYASPILRLAYLAPDIQEAILQGTFPAQLTLADFKKPFPLLWEDQKTFFNINE